MTTRAEYLTTAQAREDVGRLLADAIAEAQGIREQCDRAKLDKIGDQIMKATEGQSKADSIIALCTAIITILPSKDLGLRMNAVTVLLQDILKARIEMAPDGHTLH